MSAAQTLLERAEKKDGFLLINEIIKDAGLDELRQIALMLKQQNAEMVAVLAGIQNENLRSV